MSKRYHYKHILRLLATGALAGICSPVGASAFQIMEQNVTNLGTAYAGTASLAMDASTGFYNSAGLTRICQEQIALSLVGIHPYSKLRVNSGTATDGSALSGTPGNVKGHGDALVPGVHYAYRYDNWAFGLNVVTPFGLKTKYDENSTARYMSTRTDLRTYDIAPSVAYCLGNGFSIGLGPDFVYARAQLDTRAGTGTLATDGFREDRAGRWGIGGHAGVLWELSDCTRIGLNYRSSVRIKAKGESHQVIPAGLGGTGVQQRFAINAKVKLPDTAVLSAFHQFNDCWAVMADAQWTNWSTFKNLTINREDGQTLTQQHNFKDTYRLALGASYQWDECWLFRLGTAYDRSPVRDNLRTTRIPDSHRTWLALGGRYSLTKCLALDFGYAHVFFRKANVVEGAPTVTGGPATAQSINARYRSRADLLGLQLTWDLA